MNVGEAKAVVGKVARTGNAAECGMTVEPKPDGKEPMYFIRL